MNKIGVYKSTLTKIINKHIGEKEKLFFQVKQQTSEDGVMDIENGHLANTMVVFDSDGSHQRRLWLVVEVK